MRILFLSRDYPPENWGGIGSYTFVIARALAERGHEVHVLSCVPGQMTQDYVDGTVRVHRRGVPRVRGLGRVTRSRLITARLETALACWREHRRLHRKFDVIEAPDWYAEALGFAVSRREALVVHLHGGMSIHVKYSGLRMGRGEQAASWLERFCANRAHVITSPSQILVNDLTKARWLIRGTKPKIVRNPIDLRNWDLLPAVSTTRPLVLAVGTVEALKAPEVLVQAGAALVRDIPETELVFVGRSNGVRDGKPYKAWVQQLSSELHAPCRFIEHVTRDQLRDWYGQARVVAVVSRFESFSMVALEGMAACRPIVCTDRVGATEILDAAAGAVVPCDNPAGLADALRPYLADASRALGAGNRARALVREYCSPDAVAQERESCYRDAIDKART